MNGQSAGKSLRGVSLRYLVRNDGLRLRLQACRLVF